MSTHQTGRTLDKNTGRLLVGGGLYTSPDINGAVGATISAPYAEVGYRRGLTDNLEMGVKATIPGTIALDGKHQILEGDVWALSGGLSLGYLNLSSSVTDGSGNTVETKNSIIDVTVPFYGSVDVAPVCSIYTSPKYVLRTNFISGTDVVDSPVLTHQAGATLGVRLGKPDKAGVFVEGTYLQGLDNTDFNAFQVNGAFYF